MTTGQIFQSLKQKGCIPPNFVTKVAKRANYNTTTVRNALFGYTGYVSNEAYDKIRSAFFLQLAEINGAIVEALGELNQ